MKIVDMPIGQINPAPYNPRKITDEELSGLKESIKKFGFVEHVIVNSKTGTLISGHQRVKAAELLGHDTVPVFHVELSLSEEKALNVVLNSQHISGNYDQDILNDLLKEIKVDIPEFEDLRLDEFDIELDNWDSDIEDIDKIKENLDGIESSIKITCAQEDKDEVLIYIKAKLLETSFVGVSVK